jgi:HEAT repeat protein
MNKTQEWISWITSADEKKWKEATLALGGLHPDSEVDIDALIEALGSGNKDVVFWCIGALAALESRSMKAIDKLILLTDHGYLAVRQASICALPRIAPERKDLTKVLVKKLTDNNEFVVCDTLSSLIDMKSVEASDVEAVKDCLTHPSQHVSFQAEVTLRNLLLKEQNA